MRYDRRMSVIDNWLYLYWKPFGCWIAGHDWWCARIVPTDPQEFIWMCKHCAAMEDAFTFCGNCTNGGELDAQD